MSNVDLTQLITAEAKAEQALTEARAGAVLSRTEFALASQAAGIITKTEATAWLAGGTIPAAAAAALAFIPDQTERDEAEIRFIGAQQIDRTNPIISLLQAHLSLTDGEVDALFGIA
ncbi:MAG: hypothetical protein KI788_14145 [Mameliella sp.]|nr:hypothetical protein [Mameliella sp.]